VNAIVAGKTQLLPTICQGIADLASKDASKEVAACTALMVALADPAKPEVAQRLYAAGNYGCLVEREYGKLGVKQVFLEVPCAYDVLCSMLEVKLTPGKQDVTPMCPKPEMPYVSTAK